jgi:hypothetical protein
MTDAAIQLRTIRREIEEATGDLRDVSRRLDMIAERAEAGAPPDRVDLAILDGIAADAVRRVETAKVGLAAFAADHPDVR